jgi:ribosomal protein S18 acetylase RimI-like enzyme
MTAPARAGAEVTLRGATLADFDRLLRLVEEFHAFEHVEQSDAIRRAALRPLLADPNLGRVWFIEHAGSAVGYVAVCFGYSIEFRGRDAFVDEVFISEAHRGRGIGGAALRELGREVEALGLKALHLEVDRDNAAARRLYESAGFRLRERYCLMSWRLPGSGSGG